MAYVCSVVSVISYPLKSLSIFLQGFDVNNVRAEADVKYVFHSQVMHSEMGKPTCIWPLGASSLVKCYFCQVSHRTYIHDQFCSLTCGFSESALKKCKYYHNKLKIRKTASEIIKKMLLKYIVSRVQLSKQILFLEKISFPEENFVLASTSSDVEGAPNSLVKETL